MCELGEGGGVGAHDLTRDWRVLAFSLLYVVCCVCSVMSDSFVSSWAVACQPPPPVDFPGKNTEVGCRFLCQGIFLIQGSNLSPALADGCFTTEPPGKPTLYYM